MELMEPNPICLGSDIPLACKAHIDELKTTNKLNNQKNINAKTSTHTYMHTYK
jgi:hypothetical protein